MASPDSPAPQFVRFLPGRLEPIDLSTRNLSGQRQTLRFYVSMHGRIFRVKEFFMDWFYPGFPKNLMASFQKTYSEVVSEPVAGGVLFMGNDYRGLSSCSITLMGTQIEVESSSPAHSQHFRNLISDLVPVDGDLERVKRLAYTKRSFLAGGGSGDWYEDARISRMKWVDMGRYELGFLPGSLLVSAAGFLVSGNEITHAIIVMESPDLSESSWIDIGLGKSGSGVGQYRFREEIGIFNQFEFSGIQVMRRHPMGPALARVQAGDYVVTASFFPGEHFPGISEIRDLAGSIQFHTADLLDMIRKRGSFP